MQTTVYGYVRVSTKEQCEDRQMLALRAFPVGQRNIYMDKLSGKDFNRPQYQRMLRKLRQGDVLVLKSIDRLGRNYDEILSQWRMITKEKRADIVVLDMPLLDTRQTGRDLTGTFIADLVLQILSYVAQTERGDRGARQGEERQILSYVAQTERENTRQRQREGIEAARRRGVQFGRPRMELPPDFPRLRDEWENKQITSREAARRLHVSQDTFLRWAHDR